MGIRKHWCLWKLLVHFSLSHEVLISFALLLYVKVVHMQGSVDSASTKPGRRKVAASLRGGSALAIDWK
jgi:hypothetical protein